MKREKQRKRKKEIEGCREQRNTRVRNGKQNRKRKKREGEVRQDRTIT